MNFKGDFNIKLVWDYIYQLRNETIQKSNVKSLKNRDFSRFDLKVNRL